MWVRLARWRNQSQSPCLKALGGVFKKERWQEYMNNSSHPQSPLLKLISSILGCDFCSPTTLSLCSSHWAVERDFTTESLFWRKGTIPIEGAGGWGELSHPQRPVLPPPSFRSNSIKGGYMQGKGCEVTWHAMQLPSSYGQSDHSQQGGGRWGCVDACGVHCSQCSVYG